MREKISPPKLFHFRIYSADHLAANDTVNIMVLTAALDIDGPTSKYTSTADSGNPCRRRPSALPTAALGDIARTAPSGASPSAAWRW